MNVIDAPDPPFRLNAPIEHITKLDDGTLLLHVTVTSEAPDDQGEVVDYDGFKAAAPELMKWAILSEMHDEGRTDAGTILRLYLDDDARKAEADVHVVDPVAVKKVLNRVYKMVSLGGTKLQTRLDHVAGRTVKRIVKLRAGELSLVPYGSNPDAMIAKQFVLAKMAETPPEVSDEPTITEEERHALIDEARELLAKASADPNVGGGRVRENIPTSDFVFPEDAPDGGFPIASAGDVQDAVSSWGRYKGSHSFEEFKSRLTSIANRKGYSLPKAWQKENKKMAKAARKAADAAEPEQEPMAKAADAPDDAKDGDGEAKPPFPGAKPPIKGKAAKRARKMRKQAAVDTFAKGKNKTIKMLAEALEATTCAISEEASEGDTAAVKALQDIGNAIHEQLMTEAAEVEPDDGLDDMDDGDEDAMDDEAPMAYAKARRRLADRAPRIAKRLAKQRKANAKLRKARKALLKERRTLKKASALTGILMRKSGARNSAADIAKIDAIHAATVDLGTTAHKADEAPATLEVTEDPMTKSATAPAFSDQMREALASVLPAEKLDALEARLTEQGEALAKLASRPTGGGPYRVVPRGPEEAAEGARGEVLAKAAELIDDPRLRSEVSTAAALEMIQSGRGR